MATQESQQPTPRAVAAAEAAVRSIGLGFDMVMDCRSDYCKQPDGLRLIDIDNDDRGVIDLAIPGGISIPSVPGCIKCGKGERLRFISDVLPFQQMSELFNQEVSLPGRIPTGHFNATFEFSGQWLKDSEGTRALAFEGVFITLYSIELEKLQIVLSEHVKQAIPASWDPAALAKFIEKFGTHVITGVKVGGKDVIYVKQNRSSPLQPVEVMAILKNIAEKRFGDAHRASTNSKQKTFSEEMLNRIEHGLTFMDSSTTSIYSHKEEITFFWRRRGGSNTRNITHENWCQSVKDEPEVIAMTFVPIASLLSGICGSGYISHAINLYLRYKPPVESLHLFLDFQRPKQWAPAYGELTLVPMRKQEPNKSLQFSFLGPKLYVNTDLVDVAKRPVTGARLYLEGRRSNCLAIHLQHLSERPKTLEIFNESSTESSTSFDQRYHEKVRWKIFSHISTAPVESKDSLSIVTGAQFQVRKCGMQNVLFLMLQFSQVSDAAMLRKQEWDVATDDDITGKSGIFSLISSFSTGTQKQKQQEKPTNINSAAYPDGPPSPNQVAEFLSYVDTTEKTRGPQDLPGFWLMSGAKLGIVKGKISLGIKCSLFGMG